VSVAAADVATASSAGSYFAFETAGLEAAFIEAVVKQVPRTTSAYSERVIGCRDAKWVLP